MKASLLAGLPVIALFQGVAFAALPDIIPIVPRASEDQLEIGQRVILPAIGKDSFYSIRFWAEDKDKPQPEVTQLVEMPPGANELPLLRYFSPGTRYRWLARLHRLEDARPAVAEMRSGPAFRVKAVQAAPSTGATIAITEPSDDRRVRVVDGDARLKWHAVPSAATYVVATCIVDESESKDAITVEECPEGKSGNIKRPKSRFDSLKQDELPWAYVAVTPGKRVSFYVKAMDETGTAIAYSAQRAFDIAASPFAPWVAKGFSLSGTLDPNVNVSKNFATLGYSRGIDKDGDYRFFRSQFALQWKGDDRHSPAGLLAPSASLEAILNSRGKKRGDDKIVLRAGVIDYISSVTLGNPDTATAASTPAARLLAALKYETNRSTSAVKRTEKTLAELRITPEIPGFPHVINIPEKADYTGRNPEGLFQARIIPTLGIDRGRTDVVGASEETSRNVLRYVGQLRVELGWANIATPAGTVTAFAERTWYRLPWETLKSPAYVTSGIDIPLTAETAFSIRYNVGRTAPLFLHARSFDVGIGVKF